MRPSSFFVGAGHRVLVMWVLAIDCPLVVDGGGAVLVGWVVIGMVGLLTVCKRMNNVVIHLHGMALRPWHAPVVVFRGCWSSCASHVGASHQLPVGGRWWWCCVSGVGGNRRGGAAYLVFAGPVDWTENFTETELDTTAKDRTTGCGCPDSESFWLPVLRFDKN